jgi:hypothetical protein
MFSFYNELASREPPPRQPSDWTSRRRTTRRAAQGKARPANKAAFKP